MRVIQKAKESKISTEERLKVVEGRLGSVEGRLGSIQDELSKIRQLFSKLFEKGMEGVSGGPLMKGHVLDVVMAEPSPGGPLLAKGEGGGCVNEEQD